MDWTTVVAVLGLAALSGITTLIGVALAVYTGCNNNGMALGVGFSVGIMVLITLFEVGPVATAQTGLVSSIVAIATGVAAFALISYTVSHTSTFVAHGARDRRLRTAYLVTLGIVMHNFPEGVALADTFIAAPTVGGVRDADRRHAT